MDYSLKYKMYQQDHLWCRGVVINSTEEFHSTQPELRFFLVGSNCTCFWDIRWWEYQAVVPLEITMVSQLFCKNNSSSIHHQFIVNYCLQTINEVTFCYWWKYLLSCLWQFSSSKTMAETNITKNTSREISSSKISAKSTVLATLLFAYII